MKKHQREMQMMKLFAQIGVNRRCHSWNLSILQILLLFIGRVLSILFIIVIYKEVPGIAGAACDSLLTFPVAAL